MGCAGLGRLTPDGLPARRVRPGAGAPGARPGRSGLPVRPGRNRLPEAVLGHLPGRAGAPAPAAGGGPVRADGRRLQRAEHEPDLAGDHGPQPRLRHPLPAGRSRRRPGHRVAVGRVRPRPAVSRARRRRRAHVEFLGPRPVPSVGTATADSRRAQPGRADDAIPQRVRMGRAERPGPAHVIHARPLFGGLVDGFRGQPGGRRGGGIRAVPEPEAGCRHPQRAASGRNRLLTAEQVGDRHPPGLGGPVHLAAVRLRGAARLLRRGAGGAGRYRAAAVPADPRHEPRLHR